MTDLMKVRDFANVTGCTVQNVYLHIRQHQEDLAGHVIQGKRGKLLDSYAQEYIRDLMNPKELIVSDQETMDELNRLRGEYLQMSSKAMIQAAQISEQQAELERRALELKATKDKLELAQEAQNAQEKALEAAQRRAEELVQEAEKARQEAQEARQTAQQAEDELAAYKALPWYKRLFG